MKNKKEILVILPICIIVSMFICYQVFRYILIKEQKEGFDNIENSIKKGEMKVYPDKDVNKEIENKD